VGRLGPFPVSRGNDLDVVFVFAQIVNLAAIIAIAIRVKKYARQMCLPHLREAQTGQY
jgi:hypothetical protein